MSLICCRCKVDEDEEDEVRQQAAIVTAYCYATRRLPHILHHASLVAHVPLRNTMLWQLMSSQALVNDCMIAVGNRGPAARL